MLNQKYPDLQPKPSMLDVFMCVYIVTKGDFQVCLWPTNAAHSSDRNNFQKISYE